MIVYPTAPLPGERVSATLIRELIRVMRAITPIQGPGIILRQGPNGTAISATSQTKAPAATAFEHPWKVFAVGKSATIDHCFEIFVPDGILHIGETALEVEDLTAVEGKPERYTLDCEDEISGSAVIYLSVVRNEVETDGVSPSADDAQPKWKARIVSTLESVEDAKEILAVLPIAKLSIDDSGEYAVGMVVAQYAHSDVAFAEGGAKADGANPDRVSIDKVTKEDADDPSAIQIKNFDNSESDGGQGLVQRLRVVKDGEDSYHLEADGAEVFIVARVKGKLKYIPLTGSKDKDPDEDGGSDPCDHPGDRPGTGKEGGVPADDDHGIPGGGGFTPYDDDVGVPADGDVHAGEPCPNCSPTGPGVLAE